MRQKSFAGDKHTKVTIPSLILEIFSQAGGLELWMAIEVGASVQTEISQQLLDELPWNLLQTKKFPPG